MFSSSICNCRLMCLLNHNYSRENGFRLQNFVDNTTILELPLPVTWSSIEIGTMELTNQKNLSSAFGNSFYSHLKAEIIVFLVGRPLTWNYHMRFNRAILRKQQWVCQPANMGLACEILLLSHAAAEIHVFLFWVFPVVWPPWWIYGKRYQCFEYAILWLNYCQR